MPDWHSLILSLPGPLPEVRCRRLEDCDAAAHSEALAAPLELMNGLKYQARPGGQA